MRATEISIGVGTQPLLRRHAGVEEVYTQDLGSNEHKVRRDGSSTASPPHSAFPFTLGWMTPASNRPDQVADTSHPCSPTIQRPARLSTGYRQVRVLMTNLREAARRS